MARKSAWTDGANAFSKAYGMVRGIQKTNRTKKIMDDEKFMAAATEKNAAGAGFGLEGSELEKARYKALGNLETEFGNAQGGLSNRRAIQEIEAGDRQNEFMEQSKASRLRQETLLAEAIAEAKANQMNASASNSNASAEATRGTWGPRADLVKAQGGLVKSQTAELDALLPGKLVNQTATNANLWSTGNLVDQQAASWMLDNNLKKTVNQSEGMRQVAENKQKRLEAEATISANKQETELLTNVNDPAYMLEHNITDEVSRTKHLLGIIPTMDISLKRQQELAGGIQTFGLETMQNEAMKLTAAGEKAMKTGLDSFTSWFDTIDDVGGADPTSLTVERTGTRGSTDEGITIWSTQGENKTKMFSDQGAGAEDRVSSQMLAQVKNPGTAMTVAAGYLTNQKTVAQTAKYQQEAKTLERANREVSLGEREKIAWEGIADMMADPNFAYLSPKQKNDMKRDYLKVFGMLSAKGDTAKKPANWRGDQEQWDAIKSKWLDLSDEDRNALTGGEGGGLSYDTTNQGPAGVTPPDTRVDPKSGSRYVPGSPSRQGLSGPGGRPDVIHPNEWAQAKTAAEQYKLVKKAQMIKQMNPFWHRKVMN